MVKKAKKLSKADVKQAAIQDVLGSYLAESRDVMEKLVDAVGHDSKVSQKRERVFNELMKLELDMVDRFTATAMILEADKKVDNFFSIPEAYRQQWVELLLEGKIWGKPTMDE